MKKSIALIPAGILGCLLALPALGGPSITVHNNLSSNYITATLLELSPTAGSTVHYTSVCIDGGNQSGAFSPLKTDGTKYYLCVTPSATSGTCGKKTTVSADNNNAYDNLTCSEKEYYLTAFPPGNAITFIDTSQGLEPQFDSNFTQVKKTIP